MKLKATLTLAASILTGLATAAPTLQLTAQPGEPAYYDQYRAAALYLVDSVTSSVDDIKQFRQTPEFRDIVTSSAVQDAYTTKILTLDSYLGAVQQNLLSTPTMVLRTSQDELEAIKRMNAYRE